LIVAVLGAGLAISAIVAGRSAVIASVNANADAPDGTYSVILGEPLSPSEFKSRVRSLPLRFTDLSIATSSGVAGANGGADEGVPIADLLDRLAHSGVPMDDTTRVTGFTARGPISEALLKHAGLRGTSGAKVPTTDQIRDLRRCYAEQPADTCKQRTVEAMSPSWGVPKN